MPSVNLDETDMRLMQVLQKDARTSMKGIASWADVSIPTARARIKKLKDMGVIRQFTVALDAGKILGGVTALVNLEAKLPHTKRIAKTLAESEEVAEVHRISGESDLAVKVYVPDMRSLEDFLNNLSNLEGVEHSKASIVVETFKEQFGPIIRPGFGIRIRCTYCRKEISGEHIRKVVDGHTLYFCCNTCATVYGKEVERKRRD